MLRVLLSFILITPCYAQEVLLAAYRERPPEMHTAGAEPVGPLIELLDSAALRIGARVEWRSAPFIRSLDDLKAGRIDLIPRLIYTPERTAFVHYLPSLGRQQRNIRFIVRPGQQLRSYADLAGRTIGVKRGTVYFKAFDNDSSLNKSAATDDYLLAAMFRAQRLDTLIVLDPPAIEAQFAELHFEQYQYAEYQYEQSFANQYGASRVLYEGPKRALYERLAAVLSRMRDSGEVARIYQRYGVQAPQVQGSYAEPDNQLSVR
ncbi:substrate-binding periplasmic protein [Pseudomonas sp. 5P_3.1_Bac2]|uniref:substrate-binding periplasmic protein n=1 Tax=Pseudomonas sp. 5P_3.1_Bac2 TaxID=2971617 RepID=UPI0021C7BF94|nr:transporter substrate-binding domain-containing protein [Pseudomonas sp. 5P_3.1_Bac2]MCU1718995.1 transporter substrate-binding domain-containing protein [Pseudomonas sp. 5P_3.1_Bac2]